MAFKIQLAKKIIHNSKDLREIFNSEYMYKSNLIIDDEPETMTIFKVWEFLNKIKSTTENSLLTIDNPMPYQVAYWIIPGFGEVYISEIIEKKSIMKDIKKIVSDHGQLMDTALQSYFQELLVLVKESINIPNSTIIIDFDY